MKIIRLLVILISIYGYSQPSKNYYDYNSDYSKDRREAQKNNEKQADLNRRPNSASNKPTANTIKDSNLNDNSWGDYSQVKRQNEAAARADASAAAYDDKISRMESLIKKRNLTKSGDNYQAIYNCALDAGFNEYQAGRIIGFSADDYQNRLNRERGSTQASTPQYSNNSSNDPNINGNFTGYGTKNYSDGTIYIGNLVSGVQNGYGKKITNSLTFEGNFIDNQLNGKGSIKWSNGTYLVAEFVNNDAQGKGKIKYGTGEIYEGDFVNGKLSGVGTFLYNDGTFYKGNFLNDKFHGEGKITKPNGFYKNGIFQNHQPLSLKYYDPKNNEISFEDYKADREKQIIIENKPTIAHIQKIENIKKASEAFFIENKKKSDVVTTTSGLQYKILQQGSGRKPKSNDIVKISYQGTSINGIEFDSTQNYGGSMEVKPEQLIPGMHEGLLAMNLGSYFTLYIPATLAYGKKGMSEKIRPDEGIIFTIKLLEIQ